MTKKMVMRLAVHDEKDKQKAMKAVSSLSGIEYLAMDMKEKKLTVVGDVDPIRVVGRLKKNWHTELLTVGPAKEPEKEPEKKKVDVKKESGQHDELRKLYMDHNPYHTQYYHHVYHAAEENPNSCVIC